MLSCINCYNVILEYLYDVKHHATKVYVAVDFEVHTSIFLACQLKASVGGIILYPTLLIIDLQMYLQVTECSFFGINNPYSSSL